MGEQSAANAEELTDKFRSAAFKGELRFASLSTFFGCDTVMVSGKRFTTTLVFLFRMSFPGANFTHGAAARTVERCLE